MYGLILALSFIAAVAGLTGEIISCGAWRLNKLPEVRRFLKIVSSSVTWRGVLYGAHRSYFVGYSLVMQIRMKIWRSPSSLDVALSWRWRMIAEASWRRSIWRPWPLNRSISFCKTRDSKERRRAQSLSSRKIVIIGSFHCMSRLIPRCTRMTAHVSTPDRVLDPMRCIDGWLCSQRERTILAWVCSVRHYPSFSFLSRISSYIVYILVRDENYNYCYCRVARCSDT